MDTTRLKQLAALCGLAGIMILFLMGAAAPRVFTPWTAFKGTNGIIVTTNRTTEQVRIDGAAMTNALATTNFVVANGTAVSNGLSGFFIKNFNGNGTNTTFYSSNTTSIAITAVGITGGTNIVEFNGTNSSTSIGPSGGVHIGGMSAVGGSNLVVEGRVGIGTNSGLGSLHIRPLLSGQGHIRVDDTNGTPRFQVGTLIGSPGNVGVWFGNVVPTAANVSIYSDGSTMFLNSASMFFFGIGGTGEWKVDSSGNLLPVFDGGNNIGASGATRINNYYGLGGITNAGIIHGTIGFSSARSNLLTAATITVGASPSSWTNPINANVVVYVDGVSVTGTVGINGGTVFNTIGQNTILLGPNEWTTITYTIGTPTATWRPR